MGVPMLGLACALSGGLFVPADADAVMISEAKFVELGGSMGAMDQTFPKVASLLLARSLATPFLSAGWIDRCSATWLGEQGPYTYLLTAAHCADTASGEARRLSDTFRDWRGEVIASGKGWVFKPPRSAKVSAPWTYAEDIAVLRLPRVASLVDTVGHRVEPPMISEADLREPAVVHFVGYGLVGVGSKVHPLPREGRRMAGEAVVGGQFAEGLGALTRYEPVAASPSWAFPFRGDSGSAWWQVQQGYWQVSGVTAGGTSSPLQGLSPQVSRYAAWIDGIFPGAMLQSERLSVTDSKPFLSRNHVADPSGQTLHFLIPPQVGALGPSVGRQSGTSGTSVVTVDVKEVRTGAIATLRLRAHRDAGCRVSAIEDATPCHGSRNNRLKVAFRAEDNPDLKPGAYTGRFDVDAVAWADRSRRERMALHVDIRHLLRGQVSTTAAYVSPNLAGHLAQGSVYYTVPAQSRARGPAAGVWNGSDLPSQILVSVRDAVTQKEHEIVLRARRDPLCGDRRRTRMEDAVTCQRRSAGPVTVRFHREDNPRLPPGLHRGRVTLRAHDWRDEDFHQLIELDVDLDTLDAAVP